MPYPFRIFANKSLGTQYDYTDFTGQWLPTSGVGQSPILPEINLATGNVILKSPMIQTEEQIGDFELGFVLNVQNLASPWVFNISRILSSSAAVIEFQERDGAIVHYVYDAFQNVYVSPRGGACQSQIKKLPDGSFIQFNPKSGQRTAFDAKGNLTAQYDARGLSMQYGYENGELKTMTSAAGVYSIDRNNTAVSISFLKAGEKQSELLSTFNFDHLARLQNVVIPGKTPEKNYTVSYAYDGASNQLTSVSQTDGTVMHFNFSAQSRLQALQLGAQGPSYSFDYANNNTTITDALGFTTAALFDENACITSFSRAVGDTPETAKTLTTLCKYHHGDLQSIIKPNQSEIDFQFNLQGLIAEKTDLNTQQTTRYDYDTQTCTLKIKRVLTNNNLQNLIWAATRYVYQKKLINGMVLRMLAFEISPKGAVTEYRYDDHAILQSKRTYLTNWYDVSALRVSQVPNYDDMQAWASRQPADQITLTTYEENTRGQTTHIRQFSKIKPDGSGQDSFSASDEQYSHHAYWGGVGLQSQKIDMQHQAHIITAQTQKQFDALKRLTQTTDALNQTRTIAFDDSRHQYTIIEHNERQETHTWNDAGFETTLVTAISGSAVSRIKTYDFDAAGRVNTITDCDGQKTYQLFDSVNRLRFSVTPEGIVTEYFYHDSRRYQGETKYFNPIAIESCTPPLTFAWLQNQLNAIKNPASDITTYKTFDKTGRLQFEVDGRGAVIEHRYDLQNHETLTIAYAKKLTIDELQTLKNGTLTRIPNPQSNDRIAVNFYDRDGKRIAAQDPAGYITLYQYNPAGFLVYEYRYATPTPIILNNQLTLPPQTNDDYGKFYYVDAKGNTRLIVDDVAGAQYVTEKSLYPTDQLHFEIQYANPTNQKLTLKSDPVTLRPESNTEDQTTEYEYDALRRLRTKRLPKMCLEKTKYDEMGQVIADSSGDDPVQMQQGLSLATLQHARFIAEKEQQTLSQRPGITTHTNAKKYDDWGQLMAEAPPLVSEKIAQISQNAKLSPQTQAAQITAIWKTQALRYVYDETTGLLKQKLDIAPDDSDPKNPAATYYFYDKNRRLVLTIHADGSAHKTTWHPHFDKPIETQHFATAIDLTQLAQLTKNNNGFITPDIANLCIASSDDIIEQFTLDGCGEVVTHIDPDGFETKTHFNAFGQWDQKQVPVQNQQPSLMISRAFNLRGLCAQETKTTADNQPITTSKEFQNCHGHCTASVDGNGAKTQMTYEPRGVLSSTTDVLGRKTAYKHDAFKRERKRKLPMGQSVAHVYTQATRQITQNYCDATDKVLASTFTLHNAFDQETQFQDENGKVSFTDYNAAGTWDFKKDTQGNKTVRHHDLRGLLRRKRYGHAAGFYDTAEDSAYDCNRKRISETKDALGARPQTTQYGWNPLGQQNQTTTASGKKRQTIFNKRSLAIKHHKFLGTNITVTTAQDYNGQGASKSLSRHTTAQQAMYAEQAVHDGFGRETKHIVDPGNLALTTETKLDNTNRVIAKVDAKKQMTYLVRDIVGNLRFEINAQGGVIEHRYNPANKPIFSVQYQIPVDLSKIQVGMSEVQVAALLQLSDTDRHTHYFYDDFYNERFRINRAGSVVETRYDLNNQPIATIQYYTPITGDFNTMTTSAVANQCEAVRDTTKDKSVFRILDEIGQEVFIIEADGSITQKMYFSTPHQVNGEIQYANKLTINPEAILSMSIEQIQALLVPTQDDRQTYWIVDNLNRLQFHVNAAGAVTRFDYDGDTQNRTQITEFAAPITITTYQNLLSQLHALKPDPLTDNIETQTYDDAERLVTRTNALGVSETFGYDGAGRKSEHTTLSGNKWMYEYDGANRLWREQSPETTFFKVAVDNPDNITALNMTHIRAYVEKQIRYDENGNAITIHSGCGLDDERIVHLLFNALDQKSADMWPSLPIDDPTKNTALSIRPEKMQKVSKTTLFDAHGAKLITINEQGEPTFFVYDAQHEIKYCVNAKGFVTEDQRNALGQIEHTIKYANALPINLKNYLATGLSIDLVAQNIQQDPSKDQSVHKTYDQKGNVIEISKDPVVCYITNSILGGVPTIGIQTPKITFIHNTFGEVSVTATVINEFNNKIKQTFTWHDKQGKEIATVDANGKAILTTYDARGRKTEEYRFNTFIPGYLIPTEQTSFDDLQKILMPLKDPSKDLHTITPRDQLGRIQGIYHRNLVMQTIVPGQQAFVNQPAADIVTTFTYTKDNKIKTKTFPNGGMEIYYYDERGFKIAEAGMVRTQQPSGKQIRPITYYYYSAHGQKVGSFQPESGCAIQLDPTSDVIPQPLAQIDQDKQHAFFHDAKNNVLIKQDPEGNLTHMTHTETGKIARQYGATTNKQQNGNDIVHIDESQKTYDKLDHLLVVAKCRDGVIQSQVAYLHDAFNVVAIGPGDGTYPEKKLHDQAGRLFSKTNDQGGVVIVGFDAAGEEQVTVDSVKIGVDLSTVTDSASLQALLQKSADSNYGFYETVRDAGSRPKVFVEPAYRDQTTGAITRAACQLELNPSDKKIKTITAKGQETDFERHPLGMVKRQIDPAVEVMDAQGQKTIARAITDHGYDEGAKKIGVKDANGNTETFHRDEAEQVVSQTAADGVPYFTKTLDVFSRSQAVISASGATWQHTHNRKDKITIVTLPSKDQWKYRPNENGFNIAVTPPVGSAQGVAQYAQGPFGDMCAHFLPMGEARFYTHDRRHGELSHRALNCDGSLAYQTSSTRDFWSKELTHTDGSGSTYKNTFCPNAQLHQRVGILVQNHGQMPIFDSTIQSFPQESYAPMPTQNLTYGRLNRFRQHLILDNNAVAPQSLVRIFDLNRDITRVTEKNAAGRCLRDMQVTYNALQIGTSYSDINRFKLDFDFDLVKNRMHAIATYDGITHESWNTYDNAYRTLVNDGQKINGVIQSVFAGDFGYLAPSQGNTFSYQNGMRATQQLYLDHSMGSHANDYPLSAIFTENVNDMICRVDTLPYDSAPAAQASDLSSIAPALRTLNVGPIPITIGNIYPIDNHSAIILWNAMAGETMQNSHVIALSNGRQFRSTWWLWNGQDAQACFKELPREVSYLFLIQLVINGITYQAMMPSAYYGNSFYYPTNIQYTPDRLFNTGTIDLGAAGQFILHQNAYNRNAWLSAFYDATFDQQTVGTFPAFNVDGLPRSSMIAATAYDLSSPNYYGGSVVTDTSTYQFYRFDTTVISQAAVTRTDQYGHNTLTSQRAVDANTALSVMTNIRNPFKPQQQAPNTIFFVNSLERRLLSMWSVSYPDAHGGQEGIEPPTRFFPDPQGHILATHGIVVNGNQQTETVLQITANPVRSFRLSDLISGQTQVVVQRGDTSWESISYRAFGDPIYAGILSAYSGVPLIPGQTINLMQTLDAYNKARDFSPYERLMSAIYNSLNPAVKTPQPPPPPPPHHESFWDEIIGLVVVAVIMVVAPHLLGTLMFSGAFAAGGLTALTAAQLALVTGIAGALADAASQGVAIAFDDQHGFSVQSMIENSIAAGATSGLSKALGIQGLLTEKNPEYAEAFAEAVGVGATVQVFQMSMGLRDKFDWKFIVEQAAATVISARLNRGLKHLSARMPKIIDHTVDESANMGLATAFGQKPDLTALAGNILGDEAADKADVIAHHMRQSHQHNNNHDVTPVGKTSSATRYAEHAHAPHTASHSTRDRMHDDEGLSDLYADYQSQLRGDVNAMSEAEFATVMSDTSTLHHQSDTQHVMKLQRENDTRKTSSRWGDRLVREIYLHQNAAWARGIMGFAGMMNSNAMHIALHAANTFTRDLAGDVAGSYGRRYFDDLQNGRSTFSDTMNFVGSELDLQALGEVGGAALGYGFRIASDVAPSVARNVAGMFGRGGAEKSVLFRTGSTSASMLEGTAQITPELIKAMRAKGRLIGIAEVGSEDYKYLESMGAEASTNTGIPNHILIKVDANKSTLLEEFLHGTQNRIGVVDRLGAQGAEVHVKNFMLRHNKILGLNNPADIRLLQQLHLEEIERLNQVNPRRFEP